MVQQQANELMRRERVSPAVHTPNAVSITIGYQAYVMRVLSKKGGAAHIIGRDRLGVNAAKERVVLSIQRGDTASCAGQQLVEATRTDAEESLVGKAQFRASD